MRSAATAVTSATVGGGSGLARPVTEGRTGADDDGGGTKAPYCAQERPRPGGGEASMAWGGPMTRGMVAAKSAVHAKHDGHAQPLASWEWKG